MQRKICVTKNNVRLVSAVPVCIRDSIVTAARRTGALPERVKKKMVAEMVLLYINAELFWVVTALYKRIKKILCAVKRCVAG